MEKITFCIPSKNNLRYLKNSITSIKENSFIEHDIIVYVDMSHDGTEEWLIENNIRYLKNETANAKGIAYGYNRCIEAANTNIVCMFHADMYMGKGFDINILKHLTKGSVVSGTRIEPPLHPEGKEKIVMNFGMYPEDFTKEVFDKFVEEAQNTYKDVTTQGIFAPWAIYKDDVTTIGMHDEVFHSYHEDSDIFNRFILSGYKIIQSRDAFVYHLTCRGGQFQDGIEKITLDPKFHTMKDSAARNYIRKWGSWIENNEYQYPIITPKYDIGISATNCTTTLVKALELWCTRLYVEDRDGLIDHYIENEQQNTIYDLRKRICDLNHNNPDEYQDVVVKLDCNKLTQEDFNVITMLSKILKDTNEIGKFQIGNLDIEIFSLKENQNELIQNKNK
jgi:GT2 family glycosyltransferase